MEIQKIKTTSKFDELTEEWRTLQVCNFGPLMDLEDNEAANVLVTTVNGEAVAYLIAEDTDLWHIETKAGNGGNGYAKQLAEAAKIDFAYEVCSDAGAQFCESLGIEWEDCRG